MDLQEQRKQQHIDHLETRLYELRLNDPIVNACIQAWKDGRLSREEALLSAVVNLADDNRTLRETLTKALHGAPVPAL